MAFGGVRKGQLRGAEALMHVRAVLVDAWDGGAKVYLISPGNQSKRDCEKMAQDLDSRLIAVRSIFDGWLRAISFIIPSSYIGALELRRNDNWASKIMELATHGYVLLVVGKGSEVEEVVAQVIQAPSPSSRLRGIYESLAIKYKVFIINAEDPNLIEIETNTYDVIT